MSPLLGYTLFFGIGIGFWLIIYNILQHTKNRGTFKNFWHEYKWFRWMVGGYWEQWHYELSIVDWTDNVEWAFNGHYKWYKRSEEDVVQRNSIVGRTLVKCEYYFKSLQDETLFKLQHGGDYVLRYSE